MNILLNKFPDTVRIHEVSYKINTGFQIGIRFEMMMCDSTISYENKLLQALQLYYPIIPEDINAAVEQLLWFYCCGVDDTINQNKQQKSSGVEEPMFSYEQDQSMIYTAFLLYYHIDLNAAYDLHWWKFKQLFQELPDEAKIKKVMMYRSIHINSNMTKEQQQFYADMKAIYRLKDKDKDMKKAKNFASILAGGMCIPNEIV